MPTEKPFGNAPVPLLQGKFIQYWHDPSIGNSGSIWLYHGLLSFDLDATLLQCNTYLAGILLDPNMDPGLLSTSWETMYPINFVPVHPV